MIKPFLLIMTILIATGPARAQKSRLMERQDFESFLAKLRQESKGWIRTVSSIDIASVPGAKVAARRGGAALRAHIECYGRTNK